MSFSRRPPRSRGTDTFWGRLSPTARHGACVAFLLVLVLTFYAPVLFGGQSIHGSDIVSWRANAESLLEYRNRTGELSLWAPDVFGGMPSYMIYYMSVVPQLDTIIDAVKVIDTPARNLLVLLLGTYLLVFYLSRNHFSGVLSAVAFGFTTYIPIIVAVGHGTKFKELAYAPFVLLAFAYTLRNPSLLGGLFFSGTLALNLRAKHPQITYYVLMLALVWWIVELVFAWREEDLAPFAKSTGWLALGTGLALLMVAQPYLPIYQYKQYSVRGAAAAVGGDGGGSGMGWQKAMQWSQGVKELITLLIAEAFGGGGRTYWGPKTFTEGPHYVGGVILAMSGVALWRVKSRITWGLGVGTVVTILFALGKNAAWLNWPMFQFFPFFDAFRAPETWLSVTALGLAVLGGVGLDDCMRNTEKGAPNIDRSLLYSFGGVAGFVLLLLVGKGLFFDFESSRETRVVEQIRQRPNLSRSNPRVRQFYQRLEQRKKTRRDALQSDAIRTLLALGAALFLLWLYRRRSISGWVAGGLIVLVVLIDLWGVARRHLGDEVFRKQDLKSEIPTYQYHQFLKEKIDAKGGPGRVRVLPLQTPHSQNPTSNAISSYHYQSIGGYHAAKLQRYQEYLDHILRISEGSGINENGLDLMNGRYVVAKQKVPGTEVVYRDQKTGTLVLENPDAVPRGFFVGATDVVSRPQDTWQRLRSPSFDPDSVALLPEPLEATVTPIDSGSTAAVTLESYEPPEVKWTVQTDAPRLFVASEVYYPAGWTAYLDGTEVPIHRVDYLLRGVHVPEGEHTLVMRFEPQAHRVGVWLTGSTTALVYGSGLGLVALRVRRRWGEEAADEDDSDG